MWHPFSQEKHYTFQSRKVNILKIEYKWKIRLKLIKQNKMNKKPNQFKNNSNFWILEADFYNQIGTNQEHQIPVSSIVKARIQNNKLIMNIINKKLESKIFNLLTLKTSKIKIWRQIKTLNLMKHKVKIYKWTSILKDLNKNKDWNNCKTQCWNLKALSISQLIGICFKMRMKTKK